MADPTLPGMNIVTRLKSNLSTVTSGVGGARQSLISNRSTASGGFLQKFQDNLAAGKGPFGLVSIPKRAGATTPPPAGTTPPPTTPGTGGPGSTGPGAGSIGVTTGNATFGIVL